MANFAVIDTETNWDNDVMSIGVVVADVDTYKPITSNYYIITPEYKRRGMYWHALFLDHKELNIECSREKALFDLKNCFEINSVTDIFAYNASFDRKHLPELSSFNWYDIMQLAAYIQHNPAIPKTADCCGTGRLKCGYGVEPILQLLSGDMTYCEQHNALADAFDELKIMELLQHSPNKYARI